MVDAEESEEAAECEPGGETRDDGVPLGKHMTADCQPGATAATSSVGCGTFLRAAIRALAVPHESTTSPSRIAPAPTAAQR